MRIIGLQALDLRFPTSRTLAGADAVHTQPDYSAAYVILETDSGLEGHGMTFTIGRGNELCVVAIEALRSAVVGRDLESIVGDWAGFWRFLVAGDSQLSWVGPEKGVIHLATAAIVNAVWDLHAKQAGKPLWLLLSEMTPEELVGCIDFRYIEDEVTPDEALDLLASRFSGRAERSAELLRTGFPAYTTSVGWYGYDTDTLRDLCRGYVAGGWSHFKLKVGGDPEDDLRRGTAVREEIGDSRRLMIDANAAWGVSQAIREVERLAVLDPWWIEEPTCADDVLGHAEIARAVAPIRVATGEHCPNRVMFKQLFKTEAASICQLDPCRLGGINEVLAVLVMAAKRNVPVCPHAGGVGLCEYAQHVAMFDYVAVSGSMENRVIEYVDHLHEHFVDPVRMAGDRYLAPSAPGSSIEISPAACAEFIYPDGPAWRQTA